MVVFVFIFFLCLVSLFHSCRRKINLRVGPEGVIHQDLDDDLVLPKSHVEEFGVLSRYPEIVSCVIRVVAPNAAAAAAEEEERRRGRGRRRKRDKKKGAAAAAFNLETTNYETLFYMLGSDDEAEDVVEKYGKLRRLLIFVHLENKIAAFVLSLL